MRERWRTNANPVRGCVTITDRIVAVGTFCRFNTTHRFTGWYHRSPAYTEEVGDECFNIFHGVLLYGRCSERVIRFVIPFRHELQTLFDDAKALPHFLYAYFR